MSSTRNLDAKDRADWAPILQALIVDYLLLRNAVPGTYVPAAVKPSGMKGVGEKQEKAGAERMWAMRDTFAKAIDATPDATPKDPGGKMTKAFARGTWETFDVGIVPNKDPDPLNTWPIRASPPIAQHIMSCFDAYPEIESKQEAIQKAFVVHHVAKEIKITKKAADELLAEVKNLTHVG